MKQPPTSRRHFIALAFGTAGAALLALKARASQTRATSHGSATPDSEHGYHKTTHIETYYRSARF